MALLFSNSARFSTGLLQLFCRLMRVLLPFNNNLMHHPFSPVLFFICPVPDDGNAAAHCRYSVFLDEGNFRFASCLSVWNLAIVYLKLIRTQNLFPQSYWATYCAGKKQTGFDTFCLFVWVMVSSVIICWHCYVSLLKYLPNCISS